MDDQLEGEVLCEVFWAHVHLMGRYLALTSAGLGEMVTLGPGETLRGKMLQPGPFLFLVFLAIVGSVVLQNSGHLVWEWLSRTHRALGLHRVADSTLRGLDLSTSCSSTGSGVWELREGPVGVFGLQGRRATMEDRYCVIQDVDVGSKTLSFLGVFDGHGGQYTAEYVKDNLFQNTIDKIKQLCNQMPDAGGTRGNSGSVSNSSSNNNSSNNNSNNNNRNNGGGETRTGAKTRGCGANGKAEKRWSGNEDSSETLESCPATPTTTNTISNNSNNSGRLSTPNTSSAKSVESQDTQEKITPTTDKEGKGSEAKPPVATAGVTGGGSCVENLTSTASTTSITSTATTTTSPSISSSPSSNSEDDSLSLKKDDTYSSVNLRRSSLTSSSGPKDKKEEAAGAGAGSGTGAGCGNQNDSCYIDVLQNINYTRLLTDQILAVDRQVVAHCKARTDMSGSTAVVAVLDGELLVIGNVGDSRAVMADLKGSTIPLSFDHKPNQLKERRRIKEAGGFISFTGVWRVAGVLATSRALGDFPLKEPRQLITAEPDVLTFSLTDHRAHFIILATDGLWDVMSNEEAVAFVRDHLHEPDHGAKALTMHAFHRGSQDNITVAILNVSKLLRK